MSVASKNPFALLTDTEPEVASLPSAPAAPVVEPPKSNRKPQSTRGGRYYQRGGPKPAVTSPPAGEETPTSPTGEKKYNRGDRGDRGDRPFRGERGERGDRGRGRGGRGRGREHGYGRGDRDPRPDRHSATGVTDSQKKVHQGWGGDRGDTELKDETNGANDASAADPWGATATGEWENPTETAVDSWAADTKAGGDTTDPWATGGGDAAADPWANPTAAGAEGETKDDGEKPAGEEEGKRRKRFDDEEDEGKMTLEEWRAKNAPSDAIPKLEPRKIAEGSSEFFKGAQQLFKTDNDYFVGKPKTASAPRQRKEAKQYIEIDARFDPPSRGGRGRGGRGGRSYGDSPRGDRPERGGRGGRGGYGGGGRNQQSKEVDVEDTNAFPSLSAN